MNNYVLDSFIGNIKKNEKPLKGLNVTTINWNKFAASKRKNGILNLADIVRINEWTKGVLSEASQELDFIIRYHPESPKYWLKKLGQEKDEEGNYSVTLNLEKFLESKNSKEWRKKGLGFYIPDNYELARKVLREFNKTYRKRHKLSDVSFREVAVWNSKSIEDITALASFLEKKYVSPRLKSIMKKNNIETAIFTKDKIDFKYFK